MIRPPRFTLRALLILVALCGGSLWLYTYRLPPYELRQIEIGMTRERVKERLGEPTEAPRPNDFGIGWLSLGTTGSLSYKYKRDWGWCEFIFHPDGRLFWYQYGYLENEDDAHYVVTDRGRFHVP